MSDTPESGTSLRKTNELNRKALIYARTHTTTMEHKPAKSFDKSNHSHCVEATSGKRTRIEQEKRRAKARGKEQKSSK
jgi:hypothetical protein